MFTKNEQLMELNNLLLPFITESNKYIAIFYKRNTLNLDLGSYELIKPNVENLLIKYKGIQEKLDQAVAALGLQFIEFQLLKTSLIETVITLNSMLAQIYFQAWGESTTVYNKKFQIKRSYETIVIACDLYKEHASILDKGFGAGLEGTRENIAKCVPGMNRLQDEIDVFVEKAENSNDLATSYSFYQKALDLAKLQKDYKRQFAIANAQGFSYSKILIPNYPIKRIADINLKKEHLSKIANSFLSSINLWFEQKVTELRADLLRPIGVIIYSLSAHCYSLTLEPCIAKDLNRRHALVMDAKTYLETSHKLAKNIKKNFENFSELYEKITKQLNKIELEKKKLAAIKQEEDEKELRLKDPYYRI